MCSALRWMLTTTSLISWAWSFTSICRTRCSFFVAETMEEETESLEEALAVYRKYYEDEETHEDLLAVITDEMSYAIHPDLTFTALVERVNDGSFQLEDLAQGFRDIEQSDELYENPFLKTLTSTLRNLGRLLKSKIKRLRL